MEIKMVSLTELKPYERNPRKNKKAIDAVAESIKEFGFKVPIVLDKDNVIVGGHTRYAAAKKLGLTEVPCVIADDLTDEQVKAFRLADNKTAELAEWDYEKLADELDFILDIDMGKFGFDECVEAADKLVDDFKEFDEDIKTEHRCPKCGYEW